MFFLEDMFCFMLNITKKGKTPYSWLTYFPCPITPEHYSANILQLAVYFSTKAYLQKLRVQESYLYLSK